MKIQNHLWVLILAAGEGKRVQSLSFNSEGISVPKQFCTWGTNKSMLRWTLDRAEALVPSENIIVVVAAEQKQWWMNELQDLPEENIVVQPNNRGTAIGILLPLLHILNKDPQATLLVFPSDHFVKDEEVLEEALRQALRELRLMTHPFILFGMNPESADSEYGWIVPAGEAREGSLQTVNTFIEKPGATLATELFEGGALWNSFMFATKGKTLLRLYLRKYPNLVHLFTYESHSLPLLYKYLPIIDFSRDILETNVSELKVFAVPDCGWSDLGTLKRVNTFMQQGEKQHFYLNKKENFSTLLSIL